MRGNSKKGVHDRILVVELMILIGDVTSSWGVLKMP
jgi:hypothetical protein